MDQADLHIYANLQDILLQSERDRGDMVHTSLSGVLRQRGLHGCDDKQQYKWVHMLHVGIRQNRDKICIGRACFSAFFVRDALDQNVAFFVDHSVRSVRSVTSPAVTSSP